MNQPEITKTLNVRTIIWQPVPEDCVGKAAEVLVQSNGADSILISINNSVDLRIVMFDSGAMDVIAGQYDHDYWPLILGLFGDDGKPARQLRFNKDPSDDEEDEDAHDP